MGRVIDLSNLEFDPRSTGFVNDAYAAWDKDPTNPYLANNVSLVVQDVIWDAIKNSYPNTQYIVMIGDDSIVPFRRLPDKTAIGNERFYRDFSTAALGTPAYGALDGSFYLTDDCYADADPLAWPGGELCVPDYPIGRLVETADEIVAFLNAYQGFLNPFEALVTGYDFLTDQALAVSSALAGASVGVMPLINDKWTAKDLEQLWINSFYPLQSVNAHFDHFRAIPADKSAGVLRAEQIVNNVWDGAVLGFSVGCHSGFSAHDPDFDANSQDFAQAMNARGAFWIGNTGYGIGDGSGISYSEDLALRFAGYLADGITGSGIEAGRALMLAKQAYIGEAAPGSFDVYDLKVMMESTLYGLPHLFIEGAIQPQRQVEPVTNVVTSASSALQGPRDIALTLSAVPTGTVSGPVVDGQVVDVTVEGVDDSDGLLRVDDITVRQEVSFGRPQLPSLSFDAVFASNLEPRGVVILGGTTTDYPFDPIITHVLTDHLYPEFSEPDYEYDQWFPTQPIKVNRLGSHVGDGGNEGQLVFYPAQFRSTGPDVGTLRVFDQVELRIYYEDVNDPVSTGDWQAPVIRRVEALPGADQVDITVEVVDPDAGAGTPTGVSDVLLFYSTDGVTWQTDVPLMPGAGDTWRASIVLPAGVQPGSLSFVIQAVDGAGNVAYSANKGESYHGADTLFLPVVLRNLP